ncbi:uncharacterized protein LOC144025938 [Festucalex cinctus]
MLTPEKSGAQPSTSAQMTFHRTMTTTMGPMQDSLPKNVKIVLTATSDRWFYDKERAQSDPSHSEQNKGKKKKKKRFSTALIKYLMVNVFYNLQNVHQPIHRRKKDPKDSGWLEVDEFGWQPTIFPFAAKPGPRDAAAELNSHLPADILELFITDELLQHIVHHNNLYANQSMQKQTDKNCCARVNSLQRVFQIVCSDCYCCM